jgi:hypothetical protein
LLLSWAAVAIVLFDAGPPTFTHRTTGHITRVEHTKIRGRMEYVAEYYYREADGEKHTGRSMSHDEPSIGEHDVELNSTDSNLVGMQPVPVAPPLALILFIAAGFAMMSFEVVAAIRKIRQLRRANAETAYGDPNAWLLVGVPALALVGFARLIALYLSFD